MRMLVLICLVTCLSMPFALASPPGNDFVEDLKSDAAAVRIHAAKALGREGDGSAVPLLIEALGDADPAVRREAAQALGFLRDDRAVEPLVVALSDSDMNVRHHAAYPLGEIKDGRAAGALLLALGDRRVKKPLQELAARETDPALRTVLEAAIVQMTYCKDLAAHRSFDDGPTYIAAGKESLVDRWIHLAGVVRQDRIELYVNGKLAATVETPGYIPGNCGQGMEIGYDVSNSPAEIIDHFQGIIDEVKCYRAALAADDVAAEFALPKAGGESS